jgi:hypothetical protein
MQVPILAVWGVARGNCRLDDVKNGVTSQVESVGRVLLGAYARLRHDNTKSRVHPTA